MAYILAPSILACDFSNLGKEVDMLNNSLADRIHVDIMDGEFVPNISFGFPVLEAIYRNAALPLDVHLMITKPERFLQKFKEAGASTLIVHFEACTHLHRTLQEIKRLGMKAGVAVNPHSHVDNLQDVITDVDQVLIMSVNPGFGGQKFIKNTYGKIHRTRELIRESNSSAIIGVDGGIDFSNASECIETGADLLVSGSTIFKSSHPEQTISKLKSILH